MAILVIAEHDNKQLKTGVANTIAAAAKIGADISVLVAGSGCADAAAAAARIAGVTKVLDAVSAKLDTKTLLTLDSKLGTNVDPDTVAKAWLKQEGLG